MTCIVHTPVGDIASTDSIEQVRTQLNLAKRENLVATIETSTGPLLVDPLNAVVSYGSLRPTVRISDISEPIQRGEKATDLHVGDIDTPVLVDEVTTRIDEGDVGSDQRDRLRRAVGAEEVTTDALLDILRERLHASESGAGLEDRIRELLPPTEAGRQDLEAEAEPFAQPEQEKTAVSKPAGPRTPRSRGTDKAAS